MRRKLTGWGWATAGAICVLLLAWLGATIYTALRQHSDEERITRIERVVLGVGNHHRVRLSRGNRAHPEEVMPQKPHHHAVQQPGPPPGGQQGNGSAPQSPAQPKRRTLPSPPAPNPAPHVIGETVEHVTETVCAVTDPVTGICQR